VLFLINYDGKVNSDKEKQFSGSIYSERRGENSNTEAKKA